jgi:hypothetical protein
VKGFSKRELRIIGAVYRDCERIALERVSEALHGEYPGRSAAKMARHLAMLCISRKEQIFRGCRLPFYSAKHLAKQRKLDYWKMK